MLRTAVGSREAHVSGAPHALVAGRGRGQRLLSCDILSPRSLELLIKISSFPCSSFFQ